jgi:hypothetical protein
MARRQRVGLRVQVLAATLTTLAYPPRMAVCFTAIGLAAMASSNQDLRLGSTLVAKVGSTLLVCSVFGFDLNFRPPPPQRIYR